MTLPIDQSTGSAAGANNPYAPVPPKTQAQAQEDIRSQAFGAALTGLLPMHPDEIRKVIEHFDETEQAVETPIFPEPAPEVTAQTISLDPGATPAEIKVATGHVTTLTMLDASGEPWPIQDLTWAGNFEIGQPEEGSNVIRITPLAEFAQGNISIRLLKLKTPVTFTIHTHRDKVQYRFDARIPEDGPTSKPPLIEGTGGGPALEAGDSAQNSILDGVPPAGSARMDVAGVDNRTSAYKVSGQIFLRTPLTLLSPGWSSSVTSADGMNVFTLNDTPVVLLSDKGTLVQAHLTDRDDKPAGGGDLLAASEKDADAASHKDTSQ